MAPKFALFTKGSNLPLNKGLQKICLSYYSLALNLRCAHVAFITSLTNVTVYIQVYMYVYLHIYIHIYVQVAHNLDSFYATKLKYGLIFSLTKTLDFIVELPLGSQWSECIIGHIEHL